MDILSISCDAFVDHCVKLMLSKFLHFCFVYRQTVTCLKRFTRYGYYTGEVEDIMIARLAKTNKKLTKSKQKSQK